VEASEEGKSPSAIENIIPEVMPEKVKRKLEAEIQQVEYELHNELPKS